jgi:O-antigen ligase
MSLRPDSSDYEGVFPRLGGRSVNVPTEEEWLPSRGKSADNLSKTNRSAEMELNRNPTSSGAGLSSSLGEKWMPSRGHALSFASLFLFSVILYLRPYELIPALSSFMSMAFYMGIITLALFVPTQLGLEGNLTARPREVNLVLLLGLAALLSMPLAISPGEAWKTFNDNLLKALLIFIVIVNVVRTERRLKALILLALAVSVYLSIYAISDYQQGVFKVGTMETNDLRIAGRIKGLFENSNDLALHLVTMVPLAVALGLAKPGLFRKLVYFGATGLLVGAIIVTFSRGGFLGLVATVFVLVYKLGRNNRTATAGALVFAIVLFFALAPGAYSGRISTILDSSADITTSSTQRTEVLKRSVLVALRYPIFGIGIGNFHHKSIRELATHNAYTQVAAEMGLAAMLIYMMLLVHPFRRLRMIEDQSYSERDHTQFYYLAIGMQASLVGYMVSSFFAAVAYQWYAFYLIGYAIALRRIYYQEPTLGQIPHIPELASQDKSLDFRGRDFAHVSDNGKSSGI